MEEHVIPICTITIWLLMERLINCDLSWLEQSRRMDSWIHGFQMSKCWKCGTLPTNVLTIPNQNEHRPQWMCRVTFRPAALLKKTRTSKVLEEWSADLLCSDYSVGKTISGLNPAWTENHSDAFEICCEFLCMIDHRRMQGILKLLIWC